MFFSSQILENMLSYLDMNSFKRANLVCKAWFNALRKLKTNQLVFQFNEDSASKFLKDYDDSTLPTLIVPDVKTGNSYIRLKLSLERSDCDEFLDDKTTISRISYATASALLERFMAMKATQIIELNIDICSRNPLLPFWKMISFLSSTLEKLNIHTNCTCCGCYAKILHAMPIERAFLPEENDHDNNDLSDFNNDVVTFPNLKIISGELRKFGRSNKIPTFLTKILTSSPNLEGLHCNLVLSGNDHVMFDILKRNPYAFRALNSLSFVAMNNEEFQILLRKDLKLKSLSVALHSGFRVLAFYRFLSSQGKTLESLAVDFVCLPNNPEAFFCAKDLTKLKHLTMSRFYGSIHFVSHMPSLETLVLQQINLSVALRDDAATFDYTSKLKSLQIFGGRGSTGRFLMPAVYYDIVSFFPELRHLRMEYFTDTTLRIIVEGLPYLEELDIPNGIYSDEVLMGGVTVLNIKGERRPMEVDLEDIKPACFSDLKSKADQKKIF